MDRPADTPPPLTVAASVAAVEGGLLVLLGVVELVSVSSARLTMGLTTTAFFTVYGAALGLCAWGLVRRRGWARGPVLLAQLIQLGVAWSFRGGSTTLVAVALAVASVVVLAGLLHPASLAALEGGPGGGTTGDPDGDPARRTT